MVHYKPLCVNRLAFLSQDPPPKQLSRRNHIEFINVRQCHYDCILSTGWASSQRRHSSLQYFIICTPIYAKQLIAYHWHCHPVSCLSQCLCHCMQCLFLQFMSTSVRVYVRVRYAVPVRVNSTSFARDHMNCCEKSAYQRTCSYQG